MVTFNNGQLLLDPELFDVTDFLLYLYRSEIRYSRCIIPKTALVIHC